MSRDDWIEPPLSHWSIVIEDAYDAAEELAQAEGRELKGQFHLHEAHKRPDIWEKLLDIRAALRNKNDPRWTNDHGSAADLLEALLKDDHHYDVCTNEPVATSEALVTALENWERWVDGNDFHKDVRRQLGVPVEAKTATMLDHARQSLDRISSEFEELAAIIYTSAMELSLKPNAPSTVEVADVTQSIDVRLKHLSEIIAKAEGAAPRMHGGRPMKPETKATLYLAEDLWRAQGGGRADKPFFALLCAVFEELTGQAEPSRMQTIRDHIHRLSGG